MRIEINRNGERVVIVTFSTKAEEFDSNYERNKFFRELHGWTQTVPHGDKKYTYHREGILNDIPHMKISDSVFAIQREHMRMMEAFFEQWRKKVEYNMIEVMMARQRFLNAARNNNKEDD